MKPTSTMLETVIFDIFEKMFFLFPDKGAAGLPAAESLAYSIAISGDTNVSIRCLFTPPLARLMASNFIGSDDADLSAETIAETCKEAVNVIAGHVINQLGDEYQLGIPEPLPAATVLAGDPTSPGERLLFTIEGEPFLAVMETRD
jgi:hypothetical protein